MHAEVKNEIIIYISILQVIEMKMQTKSTLYMYCNNIMTKVLTLVAAASILLVTVHESDDVSYTVWRTVTYQIKDKYLTNKMKYKKH